jgi:hypothetical protein
MPEETAEYKQKTASCLIAAVLVEFGIDIFSRLFI